MKLLMERKTFLREGDEGYFKINWAKLSTTDQSNSRPTIQTA